MAVKKTGLGKGLDSMIPSYPGRKRSAVKAKEKAAASATQGAEASAASAEDSGTAQAGAGETAAQAESGAATGMGTTVAVGAERMMKITQIEPNRKQPRRAFEEEALRELAESIRQYGVLQPLIVQKREDHYEIIAGERRWRAAQLAGLKEVPVIVREYSDQERFEIALIENIQREDLNAIEEAEAYRRLMEEFHLTQEEIADRVGKNRSTITNSLRLLKLDERVRQMLVDGAISGGHARALLSLESGDLQYQTALRIVDEGLSVRDVEKIVKKLQEPAPEPKKPAPAESEAVALAYQDMEQNLRSALGTKVLVSRKKGNKGKIEIEYYSADELERLYMLLRGAGMSGE